MLAPNDIAPPPSPQNSRAPSRLKTCILSKRLALDTLFVGFLLTLLVIAIDSAGGPWKLEFLLYDARAAAFQYFLPKPTDQLVHLDIDEGALQAVDASEKTSWPWKRTLLAEMFDEVALARPKVVGLDIIFSEHQKPTLEPTTDATTRPTQDGVYTGPAKWVMYDEALGDSLKRLGCALIPVSLPFERHASASPVPATSRMLKFGRPIPPGLPALFSADLQNVPVPPIADAAAYSGNVAFAPLRDGRVRAVPLFVRHGEQMFPQMGLALACAQLDVDVKDLRFENDAVVLPLKDGRKISVPYRSYQSSTLGAEIATFVDIPWWGKTDQWESMYDYPNYREPVNHLSMVALLDLVLTRRKIALNVRNADAAMIAVMSVSDQHAAEAYAAKPPAADDISSRKSAFAKAQASSNDTLALLRGLKSADLDEQSKRFLGAYESLPKLMSELDELQRRLDTGRAELSKNLGGKAVLVGWTATGAAADFVPTSIHARCPGVVLHGAIFNAILTGELWRTLPNWLTWLVTALLGIVMTLAVAFLAPARALVVAILLLVGYTLVNGLVLFDRGNLVLGAAGPLLCIAGVWQGCTLIRFVIERYQRSQIEGRFRSYVDPVLVDYVVEHPDQVKLEGQIRELTVCFTDLGNFTALTAQLKEETVQLLRQVFDAIVPEVRKNNGYIDKFLGDGVMFFFGAPRDNPDHARDAMRTLIDIQTAIRTVNEELAGRGLHSITLRAGANTGRMVVGDAGSEKASDYTVLGDEVNLASRLESANKQLGTTMLVTARTVELAGDAGVLLRPVGQIRVVGRDEPVVAYEVMCRYDEATESQRRLAELTRQMVDAFANARPKECLRAADKIDRDFGDSKLTKLYRERCDQFVGTRSNQAFDCTITLAEK